MKLLVQSGMILFGTLMAAAVVVIGEPGQAGLRLAAVAVARLTPASSNGAARNAFVMRMASGTAEAAAR
jgi:hypothetical protein